MKDKYYVKSGQLKVVLLAESPMLAAMDAIDRFSAVPEGEATRIKVLDPTYIWVDDQGFRDWSARWKLTLNEVMENINGETI